LKGTLEDKFERRQKLWLGRNEERGRVKYIGTRTLKSEALTNREERKNGIENHLNRETIWEGSAKKQKK
jgi:hypothetical protein